MVTDINDLPWPEAKVIHQAEGALSARLGVTIAEAAAALRGRADSTGAPLLDVARDVLRPQRRGP